jgi:hypothetical protein
MYAGVLSVARNTAAMPPCAWHAPADTDSSAWGRGHAAGMMPGALQSADDHRTDTAAARPHPGGE